MQQPRVEPYVGTSRVARTASPDVAGGPLGSNSRDDQHTMAWDSDTERTIDIPVNGDDFERTLAYDVAVGNVAGEAQVGATLRKRYILHRLIGSGGTCRVFLAEDLHRRLAPDAVGELIALKVLRPGLGSRAHSLQRLRREFMQMQQLTHVSIARVFDLDCDGDVWFMTMELVEAPSALSWLDGDYSTAEALRLIVSCCDAVDHAHRKGIVHGDLKPGNVLVLADGSIKLIDFGAVAGPSKSASATTRLEATPQYASPAVLAGNMAGVRDDVFSLGCLAYMFLARGKHPFDRKPSSEAADAQLRAPYIPGIPLRLYEAVARALAWDPAQRQASVRELQRALLTSELARAQPLPPVESVVTSAQSSHEAAPPQIEVAEVKPVIAPALISEHDARPANTPGDYSYLRKFRGYVAGPMLETTQHGDAVQEPAHERGPVLPDEVAAPAGLAPQPWDMPTLVEPEVQREARGERHIPRRPPHAKRVVLTGVGLAVVLAAAIGAAVFSPPAPQQQGAALALSGLPELTIAPPELEPMSLPQLRAPAVRIAASKPVTPARRRPAPAPAATRSVAAANVSFQSRAIEVSPNQTLVAIPVRRSDSGSGAARVAWQIEGVRGRQLLDAKRAGAQVIQFHAGQEERTLYVPLRKEAGELAADGLRTFRVKLRQVGGGPSPGRVAEVRVTLLD